MGFDPQNVAHLFTTATSRIIILPLRHLSRRYCNGIQLVAMPCHATNSDATAIMPIYFDYFNL